MVLRLKQSMQGTERNKKNHQINFEGKRNKMKTFREFLRQRRPKTTKGVEQSSLDSLDPDNRVDDWRLRLRWRAREQLRLVHVLEAK